MTPQGEQASYKASDGGGEGRMTDGSGQGGERPGPNDAGGEARAAGRKRIRDWQNSRSPERTFGQEERWSSDWRVHSEGLEALGIPCGR